jgi:hypothetical protein
MIYRLLSVLLGTAALAGVATVAGAESDSTRTVVVADASVPRSAVLAAQRAAGPGADLRVPRTATEQLSVTHLFAERGYRIIGLGLSRAIAVDPVVRHYPGVRFTLLDTPVVRTEVPAAR